MTKKKIPLPPALSWLADAPMFIDADQINRFHDAVVNPESEEGTTTIEVTNKSAGEIGAALGAKAKIEPTAALKLLVNVFPFIKPTAEFGGKIEGKVDGTRGKSTKIVLHPIKTPQRQLVHLVLHYLANLRQRVFHVSLGEGRVPDGNLITRSPRALLFLDLPSESEALESHLPQTKLIPIAAEFEKGIELLFERIESEDGTAPPVYPEKGKTPSTLKAKRKEYWGWFDKNFKPSDAIRIVEEAAKDKGKIRWIDYRLPLSKDGSTLHLHVVPGGGYDTGVFAYNFIKRGQEHGIRIVGTLKSEPDLNVLAIYER